MSGKNPSLSVVIVCGAQQQRAKRSIDSVLRQDIIDQIEIVLVDCSPENSQMLPDIHITQVKIVRLSEKTSYGFARAEGARHCSARIVAFLEEHAVAKPGWAKALVTAHEGPWAVVGPEIHNGNPNEGF